MCIHYLEFYIQDFTPSNLSMLFNFWAFKPTGIVAQAYNIYVNVYLGTRHYLSLKRQVVLPYIC